MEDISTDEINELLLYFSRNTFRARDADVHCQGIMKRCVDLVSLDYSYVLISNAGGEMSAHYPSQLIIMEYERNSKTNPTNEYPSRANGTIYESVYDVNKLKDLFGKARFARCRARFPLPVILYKGKNICRSSTLAGGPEIYGRSGFDYFFSADETGLEDKDAEKNDNIQPGDWQLFNRVRNQDIRLLKTLNVGAIIDFMVEKKKVKFGVKVTSSEKVDKESRYSDFTIISLPYPGCEFFKEYRDNDYEATGLVFDWSQGHVDASIDVPDDDNIASQLKIDWENYKMWDLVKLTQNYMQLVLRYLVEQPLGLLIHCISGWDRTPLFVSLLRLSLWADGAIHQTLNAAQILYFTIAYDWMLFGHNLNDRLSKGEEIFFFCFYFLKHMLGEEFSVTRHASKPRNGSVLRTDSDCQLEGLLFDTDAPISSQGSNVSLNSSWSSISSKSQETPPVYFQTEDSGSTNGCPESSSTGIGLRVERESSGSIQLPNSVHTINQPSSTAWGSTSEGDNTAATNSAAHSSNDVNYSKTGALNAKLQSSRTSPVAVPSRAPNLRQRNESTSSLSTGSWQFISGTGSLRGSGSNSTCGSHFSSNHSRTSAGDNHVLVDSTATIIEDDCFTYSNSPDLGMRRERLRAVRNLFYNCYSTTVGFKFKNGSDGSSFGNLFGNFKEKVRFISGQRTSV